VSGRVAVLGGETRRRVGQTLMQPAELIRAAMDWLGPAAPVSPSRYAGPGAQARGARGRLTCEPAARVTRRPSARETGCRKLAGRHGHGSGVSIPSHVASVRACLSALGSSPRRASCALAGECGFGFQCMVSVSVVLSGLRMHARQGVPPDGSSQADGRAGCRAPGATRICAVTLRRRPASPPPGCSSLGHVSLVERTRERFGCARSLLGWGAGRGRARRCGPGSEGRRPRAGAAEAGEPPACECALRGCACVALQRGGRRGGSARATQRAGRASGGGAGGMAR